MNKCIVCECASVLYYQPPQQRPPVVCPNCGRDTRRYPSMKADDPRVDRLVAEYRSRSMQDTQTDEGGFAANHNDREKKAFGQPAVGGKTADGTINRKGVTDGAGVGYALKERETAGQETDEKTTAQQAAGVRAVDEKAIGEHIIGETAAIIHAVARKAVDDTAADDRTAGENMMVREAEYRKKGKTYCLVSADRRYRIPIPENGGVIGRTAAGAEELAHNGKISREHIRVMPAKRAEGIMVEDISANGTFLNGKRLIAQKQEFVVIGSELKLFNEAFTLEVDDEQ